MYLVHAARACTKVCIFGVFGRVSRGNLLNLVIIYINILVGIYVGLL